jgi:hypothetical protein
MLASSLRLLIILTAFPIFVYMLESPRLIPFTLQLNQDFFYSYLSLITRAVNRQPRHKASEKWHWTFGELRPAAKVNMYLLTQSS